MRYTFFLYRDEAGSANLTEADWAASKAAYVEYIGALREAGVFIDTDWLQPSSTGTTLTMRDGERRVQDGPYADTREQLGGFFVVNVPSLDVALDWAARCPAARFGTVEVRPSAMPAD